MTVVLFVTLLGLAAIDSINTSTIWLVILILLTAKKPVATGWAYTAGAMSLFFAFAVALFLGATTAGTVVADISIWMRRIIFMALSVFFIVMAVRRLKTRVRKMPTAPKWVNPVTAFPLGLTATLSDLPNAFPLFIAIERLISAGVDSITGVAILAGYTFVYALPTLVILVAGIFSRERIMKRLQHFMKRFTTGEAKASWKMAVLYVILAIVSIMPVIYTDKFF